MPMPRKSPFLDMTDADWRMNGTVVFSRGTAAIPTVTGALRKGKHPTHTARTENAPSAVRPCPRRIIPPTDLEQVQLSV